ncbi:MAG: extracellular solute-binding protein [Roseobacter sp.]
MSTIFFQAISRKSLLGAMILWGFGAAADPQHGISMYGAPALPPDFVSLPYARADAPKGGNITLGNTGGFDSLNPYVRKGTVPWQLRFFTHEALMGRSWDEPFALYGVLAESVEVPEDRSWVEFTLREDALFSDGSPVTIDDVIFSYELLGTQGHPRYLGLHNQIASIEQTGARSVKISFNTANRELALLAGMRPILSKDQWEGRDFANAPLAEIPIGSGPYVVSDFEAGRYVQLSRNPNYWGQDIPFRRGTNNFDRIKLDFYGDATVLFEAFKAGDISALREFNAEKWANQYGFPAVQRGDIVKTEIPHGKPSGMTGFVMNSRKTPFDDWRVREAMIQAFNFEYINDTLTGGAQPRISSYFSNSQLAFLPGGATGKVAELLAPFTSDLPPGTLEGYTFAQTDGSLRNRKGIRRAMSLLEDAGWSPQEGIMRNANGKALSFTILLSQNSSENIAITDLYVNALSRLGIEVRVETIDSAQFVERTNAFDFDMTTYRRALSLSPGNEQRFYWGSKAADQEGSRNLMGVQSPAADAMIDAMLTATKQDDFVAAVRALDRVLTAGRYVIPFWQFTTGRIAHDANMQFPPRFPIYGDGPNFMPEVWWHAPR